MIPVTEDHVLSNDVAFAIGIVMSICFLTLAVLNFSVDGFRARVKVLGSLPALVVIAVLVAWLIDTETAPSALKKVTYYPTSAQISAFLEAEYGVAVNDENSLSYKGLRVDTGFEMAVDGEYQECKFVATGVPSGAGYPAEVACSVNSSGTWRLLPTRE